MVREDHDTPVTDEEAAAAAALRALLDGAEPDGGDGRPTVPLPLADREVVGLLAHAATDAALPDAAWARVVAAAPHPAPRRRRAAWLAVAAAAALAAAAIALVTAPAAPPEALPAPAVAELSALGDALAAPDLGPEARLAALDRVAAATRARLHARFAGGETP